MVNMKSPNRFEVGANTGGVDVSRAVLDLEPVPRPVWDAGFNATIELTYRDKQLSQPVEIYAAAFPDMHRELYRFFVDGDTVIVELALQGTHRGPLKSPLGTIKPTGKRMDAPCCDVFRLKNGKIQSFNCYPSATVIFAQLGVLSNIDAAFAKP